MPPDGVPVPPPWLINMQRYGPPPSYPNLKVHFRPIQAPSLPDVRFFYLSVIESYSRK
jgi:splicing factor 3B subunit 2